MAANRPKNAEVLPYYDRSGLGAEEKRRADQLEALYGFEFPTELFYFWRWYQGLEVRRREAFAGTLGMGLVGPFDVLAGKFDGVELAYPAVLHWRFRFDPPELVTVLSGDSDGLHWGLWFDDHARRAPVVAGYYARDAFEIRQYGATLFDTLRHHIASVREGIAENLEYDPGHKAEYEADLEAMEELARSLPRTAVQPRRAAVPTSDGMGVVEPVTPRLLEAKELWAKDPRAAAAALEEAYLETDRPTLARIVKTHAEHPVLPKVSVLDYPLGSFHSFASALANPQQVKLLQVAEAGLTTLPDLSALENLEELSLYGNQLKDLPPTLGACRKLRRINLFRNPLSEVPEVLFELPALEDAIMNPGLVDAVVDRPFPPGTYRTLELARSEPAAVKVLSLGQQGLTEVPDLSAFTNLEALLLFGNELHDLPGHLAGCRDLRVVNLWGNPMVDVPAVLFELPALARVILPRGVGKDESNRLREARPRLKIG